MMLVKTKVLPSSIHGLGIFADELIPKGKVIWKFIPGFDLRFTKRQAEKLPRQAQEYLKTYAWLSKKSQKYCFASDNAKYFNHSKKPNSSSRYYKNEPEVVTIASRTIKKGEEITCDYREFDKGFKENW